MEPARVGLSDDQPTATGGPGRARAVFPSEDFALLREAVVHYLKQPEVQEGPESVKLSNLFHRLGRVD